MDRMSSNTQMVIERTIRSPRVFDSDNWVRKGWDIELCCNWHVDNLEHFWQCPNRCPWWSSITCGGKLQMWLSLMSMTTWGLLGSDNTEEILGHSCHCFLWHRNKDCSLLLKLNSSKSLSEAGSMSLSHSLLALLCHHHHHHHQKTV